MNLLNRSIFFSESQIPSLSETSDYGSGTDPEQQSIRNYSSEMNSSSLILNMDYENDSCLRDFHSDCGNNNHHSIPLRRTSLSSASSTSSSSSSSSPTSPSSSISNLSSISSSSESQRTFHHQHRLTSKKLSSINVNNTNLDGSSNNDIQCSCDKENLPIRKRNRLPNGNNRRPISFCENCQLKRAKGTSIRSKQTSNRQTNGSSARKETFPIRFNDQLTTLTKFSVDLTGLNINYTVEYHELNRSTGSTSIPSLFSTVTSNYSCKYPSLQDWNPSISSYVYNTPTNYHHEYSYFDDGASPWIPVMPNPILFTYYDLYLTRFVTEYLSETYFGDLQTPSMSPSMFPQHVYYVTPVVERECKKFSNKINIERQFFVLIFFQLFNHLRLDRGFA